MTHARRQRQGRARKSALLPVRRLAGDSAGTDALSIRYLRGFELIAVDLRHYPPAGSYDLPTPAPVPLRDDDEAYPYPSVVAEKGWRPPAEGEGRSTVAVAKMLRRFPHESRELFRHGATSDGDWSRRSQ